MCVRTCESVRVWAINCKDNIPDKLISSRLGTNDETVFKIIVVEEDEEKEEKKMNMHARRYARNQTFTPLSISIAVLGRSTV